MISEHLPLGHHSAVESYSTLQTFFLLLLCKHPGTRKCFQDENKIECLEIVESSDDGVGLDFDADLSGAFGAEQGSLELNAVPDGGVDVEAETSFEDEQSIIINNNHNNQ